MFERFTDKSIKVILLAQEESRRLGQKFVGSEQMLMGLIAEDTSVAASILKEVGLTLPYASTKWISQLIFPAASASCCSLCKMLCQIPCFRQR